MNKSKRKTIIKKIMNKSKKIINRINKTVRKSCDDFCKNDYMKEINNKFKSTSKKYNIPYKSPTTEENEYAYNTCKKTFCNKKCEGYDFFGDKQKQKDFKNKIVDGFQTSYSKDKIKMLKKRGAMSGCVEIVDYDVYHK
jgi:hypothetical protein